MRRATPPASGHHSVQIFLLLMLSMMPCWVSLGCGVRARLELKDGSAALGKIVDSDDLGVVVESESEKRFFIRRSAIQDVDHPGNVTATVAAASVPLGYAFALIDYAHCMNTETEDNLHKCDKRRKKFSIIGNVIAIAAAPALIWGLTTWGLSRTRAVRSGELTEKGEELRLGFLGLSPFLGPHGRPEGMVGLWQF